MRSMAMSLAFFLVPAIVVVTLVPEKEDRLPTFVLCVVLTFMVVVARSLASIAYDVQKMREEGLFGILSRDLPPGITRASFELTMAPPDSTDDDLELETWHEDGPLSPVPADDEEETT